MNLRRALSICRDTIRRARSEQPRLAPRTAFRARPRAERLGRAWAFYFPRRQDPQARDCVIVRDNGEASIVLGAIGKVYSSQRALGLPVSDERWLGSSGPGRYQLFNRGLVVWDGVSEPDRAYVQKAGPEYREQAQLECLAAVLDIRGFTEWSARNRGRAQRVVEALEDACQTAFQKRWCKRLFVKGSGDGVVIVSPGQDFEPPPRASVSAAHAYEFVKACQDILRRLEELPKGLTAACGVDVGRLEQVFLFGRIDYLGDAINAASHLQEGRRGVVVMSQGVRQRLAGTTRGARLVRRGHCSGGLDLRP